MKNNGKANAMETLKEKVLELKEKYEAPNWVLAVLSLTIALPMIGGSLAFWQFMLSAHWFPIVMVLVGLTYLTFGIYYFVRGSLRSLDQTCTAKPVHSDEDLS